MSNTTNDVLNHCQCWDSDQKALMIWCTHLLMMPLRWRHSGHDSVSNHQPHHCLLNRLFKRRSKKTSKLRVTGLCARNSPGTGEFPAQMASNADNVSIWWRHHAKILLPSYWLLIENWEWLPSDHHFEHTYATLSFCANRSNSFENLVTVDWILCCIQPLNQ